MPTLQFKTEAEWLTIRESHVGGSEIAALFNLWRYPDGNELVHHLFEEPPTGSVMLGSLSPYTTGYRLWCEKAGRIMPEDFGGSERIDAGKHFEPAIAAWAMQKWPEWKLNKSRVYTTHETVKGWGASLDYFERSGAQNPVDVKNVDTLVFRDKWEIENGEIVKIPLDIILQLQHQIGARGPRAQGSYVLACIGGNQLRRGMVHRHEPTQLRIAEAVAAFWTAIENEIEPPVKDYDTVADVFAFGDKDKPPVDLVGDLHANEIAREIVQLTAEKKAVEDRLELAKGDFAGILGFATKAVLDDLQVSWPVTTREAKTVTYDVDAKTYRMGLRFSAKKEPKVKKEQ